MPQFTLPSDYMAHREATDIGLQRDRLTLQEQQRQLADAAQFRLESAQISQSADQLEKLSRMQGIAVAHGMWQVSDQIATAMASIGLKNEQAAAKEAAVVQTQAKTAEAQEKNLFAALGHPKSAAEWSTAVLLAQATNPNLTPELRKVLAQPWSPALGKYLENRNVDQEKEARASKERAEAERIRTLTPAQKLVEEARKAHLDAQAATETARQEELRSKAERNTRNGGPGVAKLTEATGLDRTQTERSLRSAFPELDQGSRNLAKDTLASMAKQRQAQDKTDYATALAKVMAESRGQFYKDGSRMVFRELPAGVPKGSRLAKAADDGKFVWVFPNGDMVKEK